jgi:two-component system response regulator
MILRHERVLLLEDNDAHAEMVMLALEELERPPHVDRFARGEEVLELIDQIAENEFQSDELPTMAFIDLRLPGMSGLEVLARLRASERLAGLPVAILTSSGEAEDRERAYELGVQAYLIKPVQLNQILDFSRAVRP